AREGRPQLCRRTGALSVRRPFSPLVGDDAGWCSAVERRGTPGITGSSPLSGGRRPSRQRLVRGLRYHELPVDADSVLVGSAVGRNRFALVVPRTFPRVERAGDIDAPHKPVPSERLTPASNRKDTGSVENRQPTVRGWPRSYCWRRVCATR